MLKIRPADQRGHANFGWLTSRHTFSFGEYHDPQHMGFGPLRVINEDHVEPGQGFGTHSHRDMEIISYVLEGELAHEDSLGNGSVIRPGDVQRMTAGTGVRHSEFNHSSTERVHFLQIWIIPERKGLAPSYDERRFPAEERRDRLRLIGSRNGREGSVVIHQDVDLYSALLTEGGELSHRTTPDRYLWIQVMRGAVSVNQQALAAGDGAALQEEQQLDIRGTQDAEFLLFDMTR